MSRKECDIVCPIKEGAVGQNPIATGDEQEPKKV